MIYLYIVSMLFIKVRSVPNTTTEMPQTQNTIALCKNISVIPNCDDSKEETTNRNKQQ